jgi:hypothetical protein
MHERPYRRYPNLMDLIQKPRIRRGLLPAVVLVALCNVLHAAPRTSLSYVALFTPQQQSEQPKPDADSGAQNEADKDGLSLSDQVVKDVLQPLSTGLQTQNIQMILSIFDKKEFDNYSDFEGELRAFFHQYDEVNFRYQLLQVTADKDHGSATADLQMDALPYQLTQVPSRRSTQMRLKLKLQPKGWKVIGFSPANFFNVDYNGAGVR